MVEVGGGREIRLRRMTQPTRAAAAVRLEEHSVVFTANLGQVGDVVFAGSVSGSGTVGASSWQNEGRRAAAPVDYSDAAARGATLPGLRGAPHPRSLPPLRIGGVRVCDALDSRQGTTAPPSAPRAPDAVAPRPVGDGSNRRGRLRGVSMVEAGGGEARGGRPRRQQSGSLNDVATAACRAAATKSHPRSGLDAVQVGVDSIALEQLFVGALFHDL
jgi:hypothetical protein